MSFSFHPVRRVNWYRYNRLLEALRDLGIHETELPRKFAKYYWTDQKKWLEATYPDVFMCVRCRIPRMAEEGKDPIRNLCVDCGAVYNVSFERRIEIDDETLWSEQAKLAPAIKRVKQIMANKVGAVDPSELKPVATWRDIMSIAGKITDQHDPPLDVSIPDATTKEPSEEDTKDAIVLPGDKERGAEMNRKKPPYIIS